MLELNQEGTVGTEKVSSAEMTPKVTVMLILIRIHGNLLLPETVLGESSLLRTAGMICKDEKHKLRRS